eukprot:333996_1
MSGKRPRGFTVDGRMYEYLRNMWVFVGNSRDVASHTNHTIERENDLKCIARQAALRDKLNHMVPSQALEELGLKRTYGLTYHQALQSQLTRRRVELHDKPTIDILFQLHDIHKMANSTHFLNYLDYNNHWEFVEELLLQEGERRLNETDEDYEKGWSHYDIRHCKHIDYRRRQEIIDKY